jgi:hypothetical protein
MGSKIRSLSSRLTSFENAFETLHNQNISLWSNRQYIAQFEWRRTNEQSISNYHLSAREKERQILLHFTDHHHFFQSSRETCDDVNEWTWECVYTCIYICIYICTFYVSFVVLDLDQSIREKKKVRKKEKTIISIQQIQVVMDAK